MFDKLPMYQRIGSAAYKADLLQTTRLLDLLGNPQRQFTSVHIAGTNGKGSVSHMIAAVLQEAGYKTALYTSPHLKDFRERIRINGEMIPEENVVSFIEKYQQDFERMQLSFFEMTVGMAFDYFAAEKVDIAIVETGMGGRLDSTNLIVPVLSVVTNIGYDHMQFLGNTLPLIAAEKAGIFKPNVPVIIGETQAEVRSVFEQKAADVGTTIDFADQIFDANRLDTASLQAQEFDVWKNSQLIYEKLELSLLGQYQKMNLTTAVCALDKISALFPFSEKDLRGGLGDVSRKTGLMGRWQILGRQPMVIADTGHNEAGLKEVLYQLQQMRAKQLHFVLGLVNDKQVDKILQMLPRHAQYYFCKADIPRGLNANLLSEQAFVFGLRGEVYETVWSAYHAARNNAGFDDVVFIGGSTFVVAEVV